jgi:hypothetical protein
MFLNLEPGRIYREVLLTGDRPSEAARTCSLVAGLRRLLIICLGLVDPGALAAAPPRYDHVVIVVEENRTPGQIIGDLVNAPYLTSLANGGVQFGSIFGLGHPSQPNYLELFSGDNQGVVDDDLPPNFSATSTPTYPLRTANLGAELIAAGFTFAGFSEEIEAAGATDWADYDPHSATHPGVYYRRKHNPWANWVAKVSPLPANQLVPSVNRAFFQFPADFAQLPTVSFVIPNQLHDMHDGSRKMGDDWLRDNLSAYANWAKANNSLLIITWDEDDYNEDNQIPTIFYGANLRNGTVLPGTWTLHNLLRTMEDMYGITTHAGAAARVRPVVGAFATDPVVSVATLRQGLNGYAGVRDTQLWQETPDTSYGAVPELSVDLDTSAATGSQGGQVLIRFENLFGSGANQVPPGATIHSAKLLLHTPANATGVDNDSNDTFRLHRMIVDWSDSATWNSVGNGVSADGIESAAASSFSAVPDVDGGPTIFDVTSDLELFQAGTPNRGWVVRPASGGTADGWTFRSSENVSDPSLRPSLEIVYSLPSITYAAWASGSGLTPLNDAPEADPDEDGTSNLGEFAYNLNPLVSDGRVLVGGAASGLPAARYLGTMSSSSLQVQYLRRKAATAAGLTYAVQYSSDLVSWSPGLTLVVTSLNADWERVTERDAASPSPNRFARVVLTLQP